MRLMEGEGRNQERDRLMCEMNRIGLRLEHQRSLVDSLLKTKDKEMIKRELQTLDKIFDDFVVIVGHLRNITDKGEAEKLSQMIADEDSRVFQRKKLVSNFLMAHIDNEVTAQKSAEPEIAGGETHEGKTKRFTAVATKQMAGDAEHGGLHGSFTDRKTDETCGTVASLTKLNEIMVQTLKLQAAPKVEIDTFSGDPLEYGYFIENFKDVVENLVDNPRQRLVRLLKYTDGEAKDLIKHCVHEETLTCYKTALGLLEKEYGNPFRITCAYLERLKSWPQIKANDAVGMKSLYRFLLRCLSYQKGGNIDLDSPLTIRSVQLALPVNLQDRWNARVGKIRRRKGREAKFADFVEYVEEESECLSDPVYGRDGLKDKCGKMKTLATKGKEEEVTEKERNVNQCPVCAVQHDLDECPTFLAKTARGKKDFLFKAKMCFCCYAKDHVATKCGNKRTCQTCGGQHPTGLHGVTFKVSAVQQGGSAMCIVPVRLRHEVCQEEVK